MKGEQKTANGRQPHERTPGHIDKHRPVRVPSEQIVYIAADGNYSEVYQTNGERHLITLQLGQIESPISQQLTPSRAHFIRIGRSLIINRTFINYINLPKQQLILSDGRAARHELTASREALKQLKELLERELKP